MVTGITVKSLATELEISVDRLIHQFLDIGIYKTELDYVTFQEKKILFMHMNDNSQKVDILNKLTLQRKTLSTLNIFSSGGKTKKVQVEVRKKRTYVQYCNDKVLSNKNELYESISIKHDSLLVHKKGLKSDSSVVFQNIQKGNNDRIKEIPVQEKRMLALTDKNNLEVEGLSKDFKYSEYKNKSSVKDLSCSSILKKSSNAISDSSVVLVDEKSGVPENNNRKKVSNDRRFRGRQRLRAVKSKYINNKVSINIRYKKNDHLNVMKYEYGDLHSVMRSIKNKQRKPSTLTHAFNKPTQVVSRDIVIGELITVSELANKMAVKSSQVIKIIMRLGTMVTINQVIDQQTAQLVAEEMGHRVILRRESDLEEMVMHDRDCFGGGAVSNALEYRAPIVTIMGHVDHGKTSLLDCIRSSKVVGSEEGGITQHIGAYCVEVPNSNDNSKKMITFLDTPGHKAFTAMRLRGVQITDIVVLVVAVDDGVMLQTIEAIQHVKIAKIPMIVALNKIDKVGSFDIDRIKNDLAKSGVISEEWGGETQFISVSAKSGIGVDDLLNAILLESELLELKAVRKSMASGVVIESFLDKGRGPVASVLVREGTLKCGDVVLCGLEYGRIRFMRNAMGNNIFLAGPSMPVEIFGLSGPPFAGDVMAVVRDEKKAREVALYRQGRFRAIKLAQRKQNTFSLNSDVIEENIKWKFFNIILKADVQGSVEAINDVLKSLSNSEIRVNIVSSGVGRINETDVSLAVATRSILLGFNVRADIPSRKMIESESVNVYYHSIIYDLIDDVKKLMDNLLIPNEQVKKNVAVAEVRDVFCLPKLGNVAGCMILEGTVRRHNKVRVLRKNKVIYEGELGSLRRFKDDVNEVRSGMECGITIKNYLDIHLGDVIEVFDSS